MTQFITTLVPFIESRVTRMKNRMRGVLFILTGLMAGIVVMGKLAGNTIRHKQMFADKHLTMFLVSNQWIKIKQEEKSIAEYLRKKEYNHIAVYGMSYMGQTLLNELKNSDIEIVYGIDEKAYEINVNIDLYTMEDVLPDVDAVIVTSVYFFNEIKEKIAVKTKCPVLSLEDILFDI